MKKRIFSGFVALVLCLNQLLLTTTAFANDVVPATQAQSSVAAQSNPPVNNELEQKTDLPNSHEENLQNGQEVETALDEVQDIQAEETSLEQQPRAGKVHQLNNGDRLDQFIRSSAVQNGDTIKLTGSGYVNDDKSNASPWIIDKEVTIEGGYINLRAGGIVLGNNVTLKDTELLFANGIRNAIMANGYTLKLDHVTLQKGEGGNQTGRDVHVFCGGVTNLASASIPPSGPNGTVIVSNGTSLNNIYAGSIVPYGYTGGNEFSRPATIIIEPTAKSMGNIYACGAMEAYVNPDEMLNPGQKFDPPKEDPTKYKATGGVTISLYSSVVKEVDGKTGANENARVTYNGNPNAPNYGLTLKNVDAIAVQSTEVTLTGNSDLTGLKSLSISDGAELSVVNLSKELQTETFAGGGTLVLQQDQKLSIGGSVTGSTKLGFGNVFNHQSEKAPVPNHIYIAASQSNDQSFALLPIKNTAVMPDFKKDAQGNWRVPGASGSNVSIQDITIQDSFTLSSGKNVDLPINITYSADSTGTLRNTEVEILVNNSKATRAGKPEKGYSYVLSSQGIGSMKFVPTDAQEMLSIAASGYKLEPKTYQIEIQIPAKNMVDGKGRILKTTLVVTDGAVPPPPQETNLEKAQITVNGQYVYNGNPQRPALTVQLNGDTLQENQDYTISGADNINAGKHSLTVSGKGKYTGSKTVEYEILPKKIDSSNTKIVLEQNEFIFDASPKTAVVTEVTVDGKKLSVQQDYVVSDNTATQAGNYTAVVEGRGNYTGKATAGFKIKKLVSIQITAEKDTLNVPEAAPNGESAVQNTLTAKGVYDDQSTVDLTQTAKWSIAGQAGAGVALNGNVLTINNKALAGKVTVKAEQFGASGTKEITISKAPAAAKVVEVYKDGVKVDQDTIVVSYQGESTRTYTAKVFDQYGQEMSDAVAWSIPDADANISVQKGTVTIKAGAAQKTYKLQAKAGAAVAEVSIHAVHKQPAEVTFADAKITYGEAYTPSPSITAQGGIWSYTYTSKNGYGPSDKAPTKAGVYDVTARYESDTHYGEKTVTLTILPKEITVADTLKVAPKIYDGSDVILPEAITDISFTGLVKGDSLSANTDYVLRGAYAEANVHENQDATVRIILQNTETAKNYKLTNGTIKVKASITPQSITAVLKTQDLTKEYDGSAAVTGEILFTVAGKTVAAKNNVYSDKHAGVDKVVTLGDKTSGELELKNYNVIYPEVKGSITAKPVDVTISGPASVVYGAAYEHKASANLLPGDNTDYTILYHGSAKPQSVGKYTITVTLSNTDYSVAKIINDSFEIVKANIAATPVQKTLRFNQTETQTLKASDFEINVPGVWSAVSVQGNDTILAAVPSIKDDTLTFALKSGLTENSVGEKAVYRLTFTPSDSNNDLVETTLTVEITDKTPITVDVTMANWEYGKEPSKETAKPIFADEGAQTNPQWNFSYTGTDAQGNPYAGAAKPNAPGKYTVTAAYQDDSHKGTGTANFEITKSGALRVTGLTAHNKVFNDTNIAKVSGSIELQGKIGADDIQLGTLAYDGKNARFSDEKVGAAKKVTIPLIGAVGGNDAWKYHSPTVVELTADITKPVRPGILNSDDENLKVVQRSIFDKFASYSDAIKQVATTPEKLQKEMLKKLKEQTSNVAQEHMAIMDIQLMKDNVDVHHQQVNIILPYPADTGLNYDQYEFTVLHLKWDGTFEFLAPEKSQNGLVLKGVTTTPFAISWTSAQQPPDTSGGNTDQGDQAKPTPTPNATAQPTPVTAVPSNASAQKKKPAQKQENMEKDELKEENSQKTQETSQNQENLKPTEEPEPSETTGPAAVQEEKSGSKVGVILIVLVAVAGVCALIFFIKKKKDEQ